MFAAGDDALRQLGERAALARAAGEATFAVPELAPIAAKMAADPRAGSIGSRAAAFTARGSSYHELIRCVAAYVVELAELEPAAEPLFFPKVRGELEPMLALWPDVLVLPVLEPIAARDLIRLRALPVHPLGVVHGPAWADGRLCSPAEYFFHDLDHARFKVREDLLSLGIEIGDAYQDGSTFDPRLGSHRIILTEAQGKAGPALWDVAGARIALADHLLAALNSTPDRSLADGALLVLFEVVHEKSFPLDRGVLRRELSTRKHVDKLLQKQASGFFGPDAWPSQSRASLGRAGAWLLEVLG